MTNDRKSATDTEKNKAYNDAYAMDRTGVAGVAKDNGTVDHIVLNDLYIHDVTGNVYNKHMTNGGIYFIVETPTNEATTGIARYNDVQIKNCSLDKVNRWGIAVGYTYQWSQFTTGALSDATMAKYGSSNVVIENNYLNHVGGDAITTMYLDRPMVQYNVSENAAEQINTTDYSQQQPSLNANGEENGKQNVGADFRKRILDLPVEILDSSLSNSVTAVKVKDQKNAYKIFEILEKQYGIWICPNGGDLKEKIFRVGHLGNLTVDDNRRLVEALKKIFNNWN